MAPHDSLAALIAFVRANSPFYRELYRNLPPGVDSLRELPVVRQEDFWGANSYRSNRLLTGPIRDGIILRSGGTTGRPKFSVFSRDEWSEFTAVFARKLALSGLKDGDRVANLFYVGGLYGSFIFTHKVLEECPIHLLQLPITGVFPVDETISLLAEYEATAIAALPTTLMALADRLEAVGRGQTSVRLVLFAGEPLQQDQRARLLRAFPGADVRSIGYASNDAGLLGYADAGCAPDEFRCCDGHSVYEIVDEATGLPVDEPGREGRAVATALRRRLMPVIRYPVGDRALWVEPPGAPDRKYRLLGRSEEAARVASISVAFDEVGAVVGAFSARLGSAQFQLVMERDGGHDGLVIRLASRLESGLRDACARELLEALYRAKPVLREFEEQRKIRPLRIEWKGPGELETNPRTGKTRRVIDLRQAP